MLTYNASRRNEQRQAFELLRTYNPWGKPGCGAPNAASIRRHNLMVDEIFPERKLDRPQFPEKTSLEKRRVRGRSGGRIRNRDTQLWFNPGARAIVDNLLRWKMPQNDQMKYKKCLDEIVNYKRRIQDEEARKNLEYERKLLLSHGPWGGRGPGGLPWRHPRDIGKDFHHSMGWTTENTFNFPPIHNYNTKNCCCEKNNKENVTYNDQSHLKQYFTMSPDERYKIIKNPDCTCENETKNISFKRSIKKTSPNSHRIPCIFHSDKSLENLNEYKNNNGKFNSNGYIRNQMNNIKLDNNKVQKSSGYNPGDRKYSKVTAYANNGTRDAKQAVDQRSTLPRGFASSCGGFRSGGTPTRQLMRLTGGVELVPLMRGRGRPPPPLLQPTWTSGDEEYLRNLTNQFKMQEIQRQEHISKPVEGFGNH